MATYDAMKDFYAFYPFKEMMDYYHPSYHDRKDLVQRIEQHYQRISEIMGYQIYPMEAYLNSFAFGLAHFGRNDLSIDLFNYNISLYPKEQQKIKQHIVSSQVMDKLERKLVAYLNGR